MVLPELNIGSIAHGVGMKWHQTDWGWLRIMQCNQPYLLMIGIRHKKSLEWGWWNGR